MDIRLFDNYEEDGQLSMFGLEEPDIDVMEDVREEENTAAAALGEAGLPTLPGQSALAVRIQRCSSCGKLLTVREEAGGCAAFCNNCGIDYFQKRQ